MRRRHALGLALLAAAPVAASAQTAMQPPAAAAGAVLRGSVAIDSTDLLLGGAEVRVEALGRTARTDDDGAFVLRGLPPGTHRVVVRGVGFEPLTVAVRVAARDTVVADFALARSAPTLAPVAVRARGLREMERERARTHGGAFVDRATLERSEHSTLTQVLRRTPGVTTVLYPSPKGAYNVVGSSRGGVSVLGNRHEVCPAQIFVDGVRIFGPDMAGVLPPPIDELPVVHYEAIEIYRGPAQTPQRYAGDGAICGTVLFWTRTR